MSITIYGIKTCDTCRKALKALPEASFHDLRAKPLEPAQIATFLDAFGEALVNKSSTTWRGLSEDERTTPPAELLAAHPTLMKRPIIAAGDALYLGWKADTQKALGMS